MRTSRTPTSEESRSHIHPPPSAGRAASRLTSRMRSRRRSRTSAIEPAHRRGRGSRPSLSGNPLVNGHGRREGAARPVKVRSIWKPSSTSCAGTPTATGSRTSPSVCTSGSSSTPKRSATHAPALGHQGEHIGRAGAAGVLDEVRVLRGEARPPTVSPAQPASASSSPALRPCARGLSGFLNVEPNVLIPCGWASWRRARSSASARGDRLRVRAGSAANDARITISPSPRFECR